MTLLKFWKTEVLKSQCHQGCVPFGGPKGDSVPRFSQLLGAPAFPGLWPLTICKASSHQAFKSLGWCLPLSARLCLWPSCLLQGPLGWHWVLQDNLPSTKSLIQSHQQSPFCHGGSHIPRFWGSGCWLLWGHCVSFHRIIMHILNVFGKYQDTHGLWVC